MSNESTSLLDQSSHFSFGKNWAAYADTVTEREVAEAMAGLQRLAGPTLQGRRFLDIGSGSGIHALAAIRLGAAEVVSIDIDPDSVATTRRILQQYAEGLPWRVELMSVFDTCAANVGEFDTVYSWGVLHHTGDMERALRCAASRVAKGGQFIFALYRRTWLCSFWKAEKKWYASASPEAQAKARGAFVTLFRAALLLTRCERFDQYLSRFREGRRGMDFYHDVHDWLGGWPYESASPSEIDGLMDRLAFQKVRTFARRGIRLGLFGSGCDEYVYARRLAEG